MGILVTGGAGFIGSLLTISWAKRLQSEARTEGREPEMVVCFDRDPDLRRVTKHKDYISNVSNIQQNIVFVQGDVARVEHVMALFEEHPPRSVFHMAALLSAGAAANPTTVGFDVDLLGTRNVLEAARLIHQRNAARPAVTKVIFPSSIASFGAHLPDGNSKTHKVPLNNWQGQFPDTMYGLAKVASERLGEFYHNQGWVDFRALRFPSVIGASRGPGGTSVYSTFVVELPTRGMSYSIYVQPQTRMAIIYVTDAIRALLAIHDTSTLEFKPGLASNDPTRTKRVFGLAGIVGTDGQPPAADDLKLAVEQKLQSPPPPGAKPPGAISYDLDQGLDDTVGNFGFFDDTEAQTVWGWDPQNSMNLDKALDDFISEVRTQQGRLKKPELFG
jgi:nucleoside-diphosphate-sugar epimerase